VNIPQASKFVLAILFFVFVVALSGASVNAQTTPAITPPANKYMYKGISIGLTAEEVRSKLGDPKDKSAAQDLYVFSDEESAQFMYDPKGVVTAIMLTFSAKMDKAPTPKEVFGEEIPANADGGIFKMVRYPKAGYWISYNRVPGDDGIVSVAMQKM
jgi:hypothetical protein